jgi:transcriptional regulator with XRE-family HTH domain
MPVDRRAKTPSALDIAVGRNVRVWRMAKGLSQAQLARRIGVTFQQLQKYEVGANRIGTARLIKIAEVLGVPISTLFEGTNAADPSLLELISDSRSFRLARAFAAITHNGFRLSLVELVERVAAAQAAKQRRK